MSSQFHEDFSRASDEPKASERSFGLVFAAVFTLAGLILPLLRGQPVKLWAIAVAVVFLFLAVAAPRTLALPNRLWMQVGKLLHRIVSPLVMSLLFIIAVVPTALALRLMGRDPLRLKFDRKAATYWQKRASNTEDSFSNQF